MKCAIRLAGVTALLWLLTSCSESTYVELHEPGEYKGKPDPLLRTSRQPEHEERLRNRLLTVQTDR